MPSYHRLFDLTIASDMELDGVPATMLRQGRPDVVVRMTRLAGDLPWDEGDYPLPDGFLLVFAGTARFLIRDGSTIKVEAADGADPANVRLFLLGSAMGALLYQRGLIPLHANAVAVGGCAVAFAGPSGSGKSTLAAWFHDRGYPVLADDVAVLDCRGEEIVLLPGLPRVRLWRGALEASGRVPEHHAPSFRGDPGYDKFDVALDQVADKPMPVRTIYVIEAGDRAEFQPLKGVAAVEALIANSYRGEFVNAMGLGEDHFRRCVAIARQVGVSRAVRRWGLNELDQENARLLAHIGAD